MTKKILFTMLAVLSLATIANAEPRFGAVAFAGDSAGVGAIITDDMYQATVAFGNESTKTTVGAADAVTVKGTNIDVTASYKHALDAATSATVGIQFVTVSEDASEKNQTIGLVLGVERSLSDNLLLLAQTNAYSQNTKEVKVDAITTETKTTGIFNSARVGVAYLF